MGLRGETVVWSDLMYPGLDGRVVVEARFHLEQYVGEIERALAEHDGTGTPPEPVEQARAVVAVRRAKGA
ncbi:hypothetical protein [Embleya sp. NBC_00896]|uniref:hypothetical protein n=1 Tax=Embleya sp. NBC_00896 TaxID=2975961 RepID=UPI002F9164A4|nr:hypothetical protein OG928_34850 [Embleya sp. NBC_00896]